MEAIAGEDLKSGSLVYLDKNGMLRKAPSGEQVYIHANCFNGFKILKKTPEMIDFCEKFEKARKQVQVCLVHIMNYQLFGDYRRYRRGKNRCGHCGIKLNA